MTEGTGAVVPMKVSLQGHANVPVTVNYATGDLTEANHATAERRLHAGVRNADLRRRARH